MNSTQVLVIQHVACEPPGLIAEMLKARRAMIQFARPFRGERIPRRISDYAGLVVMGGPMGVHEQDRHPFLRHEVRLIEDALSHHRPILGVCLGSQLLAAALGASVTPGPQKEIGWHTVTLAQAAATDPLWHGLPESFSAFHWHGDVFELPRDATRLAWSKSTECQAYRYDQCAYGLLFHLEVTDRMVARMVRVFRRELRLAGLREGSVLEGVAEHGARLQIIGRAVFDRWAALLNGRLLPGTIPGQIRIKRVYDPAAPGDGARFLVDRLWPRGMKKDALRLDGWLKELAPSDGLRRWFDPNLPSGPDFARGISPNLRRG